MDAGRSHWLADRKSGLGGTDGAAILGLSKYASGYDVWCQKQGLVPDKDETPAMRWGKLLEPVVAQAYCERTGRSVWNPDTLMRHKEHDFIIGTPDRLVINAQRGLECKTSSAHLTDHWGPDGSDSVPPHYLVQVCHYMAITNYDVWDLAVLIGGNDFRVYTIHRDHEFERKYLAALSDWWIKHIVNGEQPDIGSSDSNMDTLNAMFPRDIDGVTLEADQHADHCIAELMKVKDQIKFLEMQETGLINQIKSRMGEASMMRGTIANASWRSSKPTIKIDWHQVADKLIELLPSDITGTIVKAATIEVSGSRRFLIKPAKAGTNE